MKEIQATPRVTYDSSSDEEYAYTVRNHTEHVSVVSAKTPKVNIKVNNKLCTFLLDTGATVNLLDEEAYKKVGAPKLIKGKNPTLTIWRGRSNQSNRTM